MHDDQRAGPEFWDAAADAFDKEPDHGLLDAGVRAAWGERLRAWLPAAPARVLAARCSTAGGPLSPAGPNAWPARPRSRR